MLGINVIETKDFLVLKHSIFKNIIYLIIGLMLLIFVFFSMDFNKFKSFFYMEFSPWMLVSVSMVLLLFTIIFVLFFFAIRNLKDRYYCKFDKINHSFFRSNKFICNFNDIDFILIEKPLLSGIEKIVVQKRYIRLFFSLKNNKKEIVIVDVNQDKIFELAQSLSRLANLSIKEDYYTLSL